MILWPESRAPANKMSLTKNELRGLLRRPVAFYPVFARITGGVKTGIFLCQVFYWDDKGEEGGGWFYKTQVEWETETALNATEQLTARKRLKALNLIEEKRQGIPAQMHFRLNWDVLCELVNEYLQDPEQYQKRFAVNNPTKRKPSNSGKARIKTQAKPQTALRQSQQPAQGKASNKAKAKPQSLIGTETTTESKQRETASRDALSPQRQKAARFALENLIRPDRRIFLEQQSAMTGKSIEQIVWDLNDYEAVKAFREMGGR